MKLSSRLIGNFPVCQVDDFMLQQHVAISPLFCYLMMKHKGQRSSGDKDRASMLSPGFKSDLNTMLLQYYKPKSLAS